MFSDFESIYISKTNTTFYVEIHFVCNTTEYVPGMQGHMLTNIQ